jgi:hypothetical protein
VCLKDIFRGQQVPEDVPYIDCTLYVGLLCLCLDACCT